MVKFEEDAETIRLKNVNIICFIGQLFKQNILSGELINQCIENLIGQVDEVNLECVCELLTIVGESLESRDKFDLSNYFEKMQNLAINDGKLSSLIRFMLLKLTTLRDNNWVPLEDKTKMTIKIEPEVPEEN